MLWSTVGRETPSVPAERRRRRVLVVEDDELTRMLIEDVLALEGYQVRTAADGAAGLAILREWRPDAIVLDVTMPDVDAPVFRAVQFDSPALADVPVLLLSARSARDLRVIAQDLGTAAWLTKPFDVDVLKAAVARLVAR
jgi:DNA-binding response OmpR family regulator